MKRIRVKVKPNASASRLEQTADGDWYAEIKSPPVDGKANAELVKLVAERFGVRKNQVTIKTGTTGRMKTVEIDL